MAWLIQQGQQTRTRHEIPEDVPCYVGRATDNTLVLAEAQLSRRHSRIFLHENSWWIEDLDSANGTFVNGKRVQRSPLQGGEIIGFGPAAKFEFSLTAKIGKAPAWWQDLFCVSLDPVDRDQQIKRCVLHQSLVVVGRSSTANLVLPLPQISSVHARIERKHGKLMLMDAGSVNGTTVNGESYRIQQIEPGDEIGFADLKFKIRRTALPSTRGWMSLLALAVVVSLGFFIPALFQGDEFGESLWTRAMYLEQVRMSVVEAHMALSSDPPLPVVAKGQLDIAIRSLAASDQLPPVQFNMTELETALNRTAEHPEVAAALGDMKPYQLYVEIMRVEPEPEYIRQPEIDQPREFDLNEELSAIFAQFGIDTARKPIPPTMITEIERYVRIWTTHSFDDTQIVYNRAQQYLDFIRTELEDHRLPPVFAYLPFIESAYRTNAVSSANAVGMWQFMKATAGDYNLQVSDDLDERTDPYKSTRAACRHINRLLKHFGPNAFMCAVAAYNKGAGGMTRCLEQWGDWRSAWRFWDLSQEHHGCLQPETVKYVPKFLAGAIIMRCPDHFGLI